MTKSNIMTTHLRPSPLFLFPVLIGALQAQTITVTPAEPYVGVGFTQQFSAAVTGLPTSSVTWSLAGMGPLNNPKLGTISSTGLYTAPAVPPAQNPVTVQATGSDGKTRGIAYVLVEGLGPTLTSVTPSPVNVGTYNVTINGQGFVKGAGVLAGAVALSVTYVSPTQLTANGYQGSAGIVPFKVSNPGTLYSNTIECDVRHAADRLAGRCQGCSWGIENVQRIRADRDLGRDRRLDHIGRYLYRALDDAGFQFRHHYRQRQRRRDWNSLGNPYPAFDTSGPAHVQPARRNLHRGATRDPRQRDHRRIHPLHH